MVHISNRYEMRLYNDIQHSLWKFWPYVTQALGSVENLEPNHGTCFVDINGRVIDHVSTQRRNKCGWKNGLADVEGVEHSPHSIGEIDSKSEVNFSDKLV